MAIKIVKVQFTARGRRVGETHPNAMHSDADVALARQMHAEGKTSTQIARHLGAKRACVGHWLRGIRRAAKASRIIVKRVQA